MQTTYLRATALVIVAALVALVLLGIEQWSLTRDARAQTSPSSLAAFDIDILPGLTGGDLRMTSGWHSDRYGGAAIDIAAMRRDPVTARFSINKTHDEITARVDVASDTDFDCRRIRILIEETLPGSDEMRTIGRLHYYHVSPDVNVNDEIAISAADSHTDLGEIIASTREPATCTTGDHLHMSAVVAGTDVPIEIKGSNPEGSGGGRTGQERYDLCTRGAALARI